MDFVLEPFRRLFNLLFGNRQTEEVFIEVDSKEVKLDCGKSELCLSEFAVSTVEDVDGILAAHTNPLRVKHIIIEGKTIPSVPLYLFAFSNLQKVVLSGNQLTNIPWSIIYLKQLKILDISFNALNVLPRIIMHLPTLEILSVRNNYITFLPTELLNLPVLKTLDVQGNPLVSPPLDTAQSLSSILEYLRRRTRRKNQFADFTPWYSEDDSPALMEVPQLFDLCIKCILDCHIDFLSARHIPPRLKTSLEETRQEEQASIFICKCEVCRQYFSSKLKFEVHHCSRECCNGCSCHYCVAQHEPPTPLGNSCF